MKLAESNLVELFSNMAVIQEPPQENSSMDNQSSVNISSYENPFTKWILNLESVIMNPSWSNRDYQFIKETFYFMRKSFEHPMDALFYLGKSMIDTLGTKVPDEFTDVSVEWIWFCGFSTLDGQSSLLNDSTELLELILPYLKSDLPVHKQRNLCIFVNLLLKKFSNQLDKFLDEVSEKLENLLIKILSECTHISTLLYAVILLESFYQISGIIPDDTILKDFLFKHTQTETESHFTGQLKLCAQNCLDSLINNPTTTDISLSDQSIREVFSRFDRSTFLKLSHDELSVRSDSIAFQSYQCSSYQTCPSGNRFYYEVTLNTSGPMRIGWSSKTTTLDGSAIGSDKHSIGYDGHRKWVWVNNRTYQIADESAPRWKAGDVVGCYLDLSQEPKQKFFFFLNGRLQETFREFDILANAYFPAVSLSLHQQCELNIGAKQFQLSVPDKFYNFHQESKTIKENFQKETQKSYQEKFSGQLLSDFDLLLLELEWKIPLDFAERKYDWKYFHKELPENFHLLIRNHKENFLTQLMRSVIKIIGTKVESNFNLINVLIGTLIRLISSLDDELIINLADYTNLIKPYLINKSENPDLIKQRNICISYLILSPKFLNQNLSDELVNFYLKIFSESQEGLSKLFALVILSNDEKVCEKLRSQNGKFYENLIEISDKNFDNVPINILHMKGFNFIDYQIGFLSSWIILNANDEICFLIKRSDKIKISSDCLSVRSDYYEWENVYYCGYSLVESGVYYFEMILLTSGSMRIGWASEKEAIISELISYDGRIRFLWKQGQDGVPYQEQEPWKAGDVIGCLIEIDDDRKNLTTVFYHNGRSICRNTDKIFLSRSYFPSISLSPYQQVYLNFGQAPFQFPAGKLTKNSTTVKPICSLNPSTGPQAEFCQLCHVRPHQVQFSRCNHWKFCLACVGKMVECPTCVGINVSDTTDEE